MHVAGKYMLSYLRVRTSVTLLTMPLSSRVGNNTATVLWAATPVDSHMRTHTYWTNTQVVSVSRVENHWGIQNSVLQLTLLRVFRVRSAALRTDSYNRKQIRWTNKNSCELQAKSPKYCKTYNSYLFLTFISSRTRNRVSQISDRRLIISSACLPRIRSFKAKQLGKKIKGVWWFDPNLDRMKSRFF